MKTTMKTITTKIIAAIFCLSTLYGKSQTAEETIKSTFMAFDSAKTYSQKLPLANKFKLIAAKWPNNWLSNYYTAYALISIAMHEKDRQKKDMWLDEADHYFESLKPMLTNNIEVNILGALSAHARILATPSAYKKYLEIQDKYLEVAKTMSSSNPRILYLEANTVYWTPETFGGGPKRALPLFQKASELFKTEDKSDISKPYWGTYENNDMISNCQ